jgi:hypothetical protein
MPWGLGTLQALWPETTGEERGVGIRWEHSIGPGRLSHKILFTPPETCDSAAAWRCYAPRVLCHLIVDRLPDDALGELCQALGQMYEFYASRPVPSQRSLPAERVKGRIVASYERPSFSLDVED